MYGLFVFPLFPIIVGKALFLSDGCGGVDHIVFVEVVVVIHNEEFLDVAFPALFRRAAPNDERLKMKWRCRERKRS